MNKILIRLFFSLMISSLISLFMVINYYLQDLFALVFSLGAGLLFVALIYKAATRQGAVIEMIFFMLTLCCVVSGNFLMLELVKAGEIKLGVLSFIGFILLNLWVYIKL